MPRPTRAPIPDIALTAPRAAGPVVGARSEPTPPRDGPPLEQDAGSAASASASHGDASDAAPPAAEGGAVQEPSVWPATPQGIQGAIKEAMPALRTCYNEALDRQPDLAGRIGLTFTVIDDDGVGMVSAADVKDDPVAQGALGDCVLAAMSDLQFDPPADGGALTVSYPFVFRNEDD